MAMATTATERGNHGLMVREYEMNGLSPYMAPGMPASIFGRHAGGQ